MSLTSDTLWRLQKEVFLIKNSAYILLAGSLWGIISIFVNLLKEAGFNSIQCVAIRCFFTALFLVCYIIIKDKSLLKIQPKDMVYFIGTGILSIVFFNFCYFQSIEEIGGAAVPALLLYTAPLFVMIISFFVFHEKLTRKKIISLLMTIVGLCLVTGAFTGGERISFTSVLYGLGSGLGYALYTIFGKFVVKKYNALTITAYTFIIATIVAVPLSGVFTDISFLFSIKSVIAAVGLSLLSTVLPFMLYTKGLNGMDAGKASIIATAEPFVAAIVGVLLFQETFTIWKITGMILILAAIILLNIKIGQKESK